MPMHTLRKETHRLGVEPSARPLPQLISYGVVVIDKPRGPSSHEVSSFVKHMLSLPRTGHSGTLDPDVSGVLPVLLDHSCKVAGHLIGKDKEYVCVMRTSEACKREEIEEAFSHLRGPIYQTPPRESAVRKQLRVRTVHDLTLHEVRERLTLFSSRVEAGTYIRTIVSDASLILGTPAHMEELRRTQAAHFSERHAISLQDLSDRLWLANTHGDEGPLRESIHPIESIVNLPKIILSDSVVKAVCAGVNPSADGMCSLDPRFEKHQPVGLYTGKGELVAIARALEDSNTIIEHAKEKKATQPKAVLDILRVVHSF